MKIIFVGSPGTPYSKSAGDIRLYSFAKIFSTIGYDVEIINRYSSIPVSDNDDFKDCKIKELVNKQRSNKIKNIFYYIASIIYEPLYIIISNKSKKINFIHIYSGHFIDFLLYYIYSKIINAKTIYQYVEYRSEIKRNGLYHKVNGYLCDHYGPKIWDASINISTYLDKEATKINSKLKRTIIPPIGNFSLFDSIEVPKQKNIIYCGSIDYNEIIETIISAYCGSKIQKTFSLIFVLSGSSFKFNDFKRRYAIYNNIHFYTNLPYIELIRLYKSSLIGVIPLRNTIQDIARFPNKICEYCAASITIITTNFGDIPLFFKDRENAIILNEYSVESLIANFNWASENIDKIYSLCLKSYDIGLKKFDLESYTKILCSFLDKVNNND